MIEGSYQIEVDSKRKQLSKSSSLRFLSDRFHSPSRTAVFISFPLFFSMRNHPYPINEILSTDLRSETCGFGPPPNYENLPELNEPPPSYDCVIELDRETKNPNGKFI